MSLFAAIGHLAHKLRDVRANYVTEREISSLPFEIQKDIGWANACDGPRPRSLATPHLGI